MSERMWRGKRPTEGKLTGGGYEIEESLLGEQRVFQAPEVEFQDSGH